MAIYSIRLYSKDWLPVSASDGSLAVELARARNLQMDHAVNEVSSFRFSIPRGDPALRLVNVGNICRIYRNGNLYDSGIVVGPLDKDRHPEVQVNCLGKAEILNWRITPWNFELKTTTPGSQVNELLSEYRFFRENAKAQFAAGSLQGTDLLAIAQSTITSEDNWWITLSTVGTTGGGTAIYNTHGTFVSKPLDMGTPMAFSRFRYEANLSNDTDLQFRLRVAPATTPAAPTPVWTAWSATAYVLSADQQQRGYADFAPSTPFRWVQAQWHFYTTDTSITPGLRAYEFVGAYPMEISIGSLVLPTVYKRRTFSYMPHLRALTYILEDVGAEFEVTSGYTLNVKGTLGNPATAQAIHEDWDANVSRWEEDDDGLSNALFMLGPGGGGLNNMASYGQSTTSQHSYGRRQGIAYAVGTTFATVQTQAGSQVADTGALKTQITAQLLRVPQLELRKGDTVRFVSQARNVDQTFRVQAQQRQEGPGGEIIRVELSRLFKSLTDDLSEQVTSGVDEDAGNYPAKGPQSI